VLKPSGTSPMGQVGMPGTELADSQIEQLCSSKLRSLEGLYSLPTSLERLPDLDLEQSIEEERGGREGSLPIAESITVASVLFAGSGFRAWRSV